MTENFDNVKSFDITKENSTELKKKEIHEFFTSPVRMEQLKKSLPNVGITAERMTRILFSSIAKTPKLATCTPKSLFNSMIQCAQIGLEPGTVLGHAYIIPYGNTATLVIGYKGLIELCRRSKEFSTIYAQEVYDGDTFELILGTDQYIKHKPNYAATRNDANILGCYAVVKFKDGSCMFEFMTKNDIEKIRKGSVNSKSEAWMKNYVMMARKTVIRRLMHYLPLTIELAEAIKIDSESEIGISSDVLIDATDAKNEKPKKKEKKKSGIDEYIESFKARGITENEICNYFFIDKISQMNNTQVIELKKVITDIESETMSAEEFKKTAAERLEMSK